MGSEKCNYCSGSESLLPSSLVEDWNSYDNSVNEEGFTELCESNKDEEHLSYTDAKLSARSVGC